MIILIIHEIISCIQYFFSFNFFNSILSPLLVVAMLVKIFGTLDWESTKDSSGGHDNRNRNLWYLVPKIFYGVNGQCPRVVCFRAKTEIREQVSGIQE